MPETGGTPVLRHGAARRVVDLSFRLARPSLDPLPAMSGEKLIVMVKAPRPGAVKTRLAKTIGATAACAAYRRMVGVLLSNLSSLSGVELRYTPDDAADDIQPWCQPGWTSHPQGDGDLGQRLKRAFAEAFASGAQHVAVLGSDCPEVTAGDVREAWTGLKTHELVVGPATDGGYWLIGLSQPQPQLFDGVHWSSETVRAETYSAPARVSCASNFYVSLPTWTPRKSGGSSWRRTRGNESESARLLQCRDHEPVGRCRFGRR